jgi:hypothetical protein
VEAPPADIQIKEKIGATTRSNKPEEPTTPPAPPAPSTPTRKPQADKPKNESRTEPPPSQPKKSTTTSAKSYVDRQVQSFIDYQGKEYRIEGTVVEQKRRTKGASKVWSYRIRWDEKHSSKYDYKEFEWIKKNDLLKILKDQ